MTSTGRADARLVEPAAGTTVRVGGSAVRTPCRPTPGGRGRSIDHGSHRSTGRRVVGPSPGRSVPGRRLGASGTGRFDDDGRRRVERRPGAARIARGSTSGRVPAGRPAAPSVTASGPCRRRADAPLPVVRRRRRPSPARAGRRSRRPSLAQRLEPGRDHRDPGGSAELGGTVPPLPYPAGRHLAVPERRACATKRWNGRVVWNPAISVSSSARRSRSMAASRSPASTTMNLAIRLSYPAGRGRRPGYRCRPEPRVRPASTQRRIAPGRRREVAGRVLGGDPDLDRVAPGSAACAAAASAASDNGRPAASQNCSRTMSSPDTSSVTPCSTWSRVLTSRNQKEPSGDRGGTPPSRHSEAGRAGDPDRHRMELTSRVRRRDPAPAPPRRASDVDAGASSRAPRSRRRPVASPRSWTSMWRAGTISRSR